jgi:hypothetical protein
MRRLSTAFAGTALVTTGVLALVSTAAASAAADPHRPSKPPATSYVAMGDSYSATGIPPLDPGPAGNECGRSDATDLLCDAVDLGDRLHVKDPRWRWRLQGLNDLRSCN